MAFKTFARPEAGQDQHCASEAEPTDPFSRRSEAEPR